MKYQGPRCEIVRVCFECQYCMAFSAGDFPNLRAGYKAWCCHLNLRGPKKLINAEETPPNWCPLDRWHE